MKLNIKKILNRFLPENDLKAETYLTKAIYHQKNNTLVLQISCNLTDRQQLENFFQELFPSYFVKCHFKSQELKVPQLTVDFLLEMLREDYPEHCACLSVNNLMISEKSIVIKFPLQLKMQDFQDQSCDVKIEEKIRHIFSKEYTIEVTRSELIENTDYLNTLTEKERQISKANATVQPTSLGIPMTEKTNDITKPLKKGRDFTQPALPIEVIKREGGEVVIEGEIIDIDVRLTANQKYLIKMDLADETSAILCKLFLSVKEYESFGRLLKNGICLRIKGSKSYDTYDNTDNILIQSFYEVPKKIKKDMAKTKRVELHMYSQMSMLDGFVDLKKLTSLLKLWNHHAFGITDAGSVQSYPDICNYAKQNGLRPLYGIECRLVNEDMPILMDENEATSYTNFTVFDIETTGLSKIHDEITEIGAVRIENGKIVDVYNQLVNPHKNIPDKIVELTGITNEMVAEQPSIGEVLPDFFDFAKNTTFVAHNATFDVGFIREKAAREHIEHNISYVDTLALGRALCPQLKNHKLDTLAKHFSIPLENHHRACDDAKATAEIYLKMLELLEEKDISFNSEINQMPTEWPLARRNSFNAVIYVKNTVGLKNLYQIVSQSNLKYFYREACVPKSLLKKYREGLIVSSGNMFGELYQAMIAEAKDEQIEHLLDYYDYFELQPLSSYKPLVQLGQIGSLEDVKQMNFRIYEMAQSKNKLTVATGDVHYIHPSDSIARNIILESRGKKREIERDPQLFLRTTDEMLDEFSYFPEPIQKEIVIDNTHKIADLLEDILPIPNGTFPPIIEGSDKELREITYEKARSIYGEELPAYVKDRLDRELNSIIANGYAVLYIIAQKLVWRSNEDGYLVGSRGSVGSSFVATMAGITEVNPLKPHYICPHCYFSEFIDDENIGSGIDLPDKNCPKCSHKLNKEGHNIPFEVFLGFEGDKEPDIDLNFAGEYQPTVHKYTEELFGEGKVFRAGTIGTIADTTAYGYIKKYCEKNSLQLNSSEMKKLQKIMVGVKRTTGQHPGGVMIVPRDKDITDFCPIQHPADDIHSDIVTTHFNYKAISGRILKLDLLGHDVPSIIRMLSDLTGVDPLKIPLDDEETMKIFTSSETLYPICEYSNSDIGTLGIPEFGTTFVRQMLKDTMPKTFSELVRISGLSHGTNVWLNNAQDLVRANVITLKDVISTRDDIMIYLIQKGLDKKKSFKIMETVRKNKPLDADTINYMREFNVPEWYIESCKKIEYLFPKAHAVAYVLMSYRIAYFKVHYPEAFYATYFTTKISDYPGDLVCHGLSEIQNEMSRIQKLGKEALPKDKNVYTILEVAEEMYARGIQSKKVSFEKSHSLMFTCDEPKFIQPPFRALPGVSDAHSISIYEACQKLQDENPFLSIEDLKKKTNVNKVALESLEKHGTLKGLSQTNQLDLFSLM